MIELAVIQRICAGQTYEQIAEAIQYSTSYLSRTFCPQLWHLLSEVCGTPINKKNLLTSLVLINLGSLPSKDDRPSQLQHVNQIDWGEAIDVSGFQGRITNWQL
jgi:hypothetical protein